MIACSGLDQSESVLFARIWIGLGCATCLMVASAAAWAQGPLYHVRVPVPDQSQVAWQRAVAEGCGQLMLRVGSRPKQDQLSAMRPSDLVSRFAYRRQENQLWLDLWFDAGALDTEATAAGQRIWPEGRPPVLCWLAISPARSPKLLTLGDYPALGARLVQHANARGLSLLLPLMDLQDRSVIGPQLVWQGDQAAVWRATQRYGRVGMLLGRLDLDNHGDTPQWRARWYWRPPEGQVALPQLYETHAALPDEAIVMAVDHLLAVLSDEHQTNLMHQDHGPLRVDIVGIHDWAAHQAALKALRAYPGIEGLQSLEMGSGHLYLAVADKAGLLSLRDLMRRDPHWQLISDAADDADLHCRWLGRGQKA